MSTKPITIKDIAAHTGYSIATVSRVLNEKGNVKPQTAESILSVAHRLNYVPNQEARNLVKASNNTLAFIVNGLEPDGGEDNILYRILTGMHSWAQEKGYEVSLLTMSSSHQKKQSYVDFCRKYNVAGAVIYGVKVADPYFQELVPSHFPCVLMDAGFSLSMPTISIDNTKAFFDITNVFIQKGHTHIAYIGGDVHSEINDLRLVGYKQALEEAGIPFCEDYVFDAQFLKKEAFDRTLTLIETYPEITGIACASDFMAFGCYEALELRGLQVGKEISVSGFDNTPSSFYIHPKLSTVGQNFYQMGIQAVTTLLNLLETSVATNVVEPYEIISRDSIGSLF